MVVDSVKMATAEDSFVKVEIVSDEELVSLEPDDEPILVESADTKNTQRVITYAISKFDKFLEATGAQLAAVTASKQSLDITVSKFYVSLMNMPPKIAADGYEVEHHSKKTMQTIKYGLQKYFSTETNWDLSDKYEFRQSNDTFAALMGAMKKTGKAIIKHKVPISPQDMTRILSSEELDMSTSTGLQNKVFMDIMLHNFCTRGRENLREMRWCDFQICTDADGMRYVRRRNHHENEDYPNPCMYEIRGSKACPVASFQKYLSKLNPQSELLFQKPKRFARPAAFLQEEVWYQDSPVGVNTLGTKMKVISMNAGCSKVYTNYCLRTTCTASSTPPDVAGSAIYDGLNDDGYHSMQPIQNINGSGGIEKRRLDGSEQPADQRLFKLFKPSVASREPHREQGNVTTDEPEIRCDRAKSTSPVDVESSSVDDESDVEHLPSSSFTPEQEKQEETISNATVNISTDSKSSTGQTFNFYNCVVNIYHNHSK